MPGNSAADPSAITTQFEEASQHDLLASLLGTSGKRPAAAAGLSTDTPRTKTFKQTAEHAQQQATPETMQSLAANVAQPDTGGSAYSARTHHENSGDVEEDGGEEAPQEAQPEEPAVELTQTLSDGAQDMISRLHAIETKIQELVQVGIAHIDQIKENFVAEMSRMCEDLRAMCEYQQGAWSELAMATLQESKRLDMARELVGHLGLAATGGHAEQ